MQHAIFPPYWRSYLQVGRRRVEKDYLNMAGGVYPEFDDVEDDLDLLHVELEHTGKLMPGTH